MEITDTAFVYDQHYYIRKPHNFKGLNTHLFTLNLYFHTCQTNIKLVKE